MTHVIRQQYVHVEVNGAESDGLALQRSLPDWCHQWLTPVIEQALERCAPRDGYLCINRLQVDVGTLAIEDLEQDLPELVASALEKAIREQVPATATPGITLGNNAVQHKTAQQSLDEAFIYFLETGSLPWSFHLPDGHSLEQAVLHSWRDAAAHTEAGRVVRDAVVRMLESPSVRHRLIWQFSPEFRKTLLSLLSREAKSVVDGIVSALSSSTIPLAEIASFEVQLWEIVFADIAAGRVLVAHRLISELWDTLAISVVEYPALEILLERHWPGVTRGTPGATRRIERAESMQPAHNELTQPYPSRSEDTAKDINEYPESRERWDDLETRGAEEGEERPERPEAVERREYVEVQESGEPREHPEVREGIYVGNAGLVLLHPFLPQLFTALDITRGNELLQPDRALSLLHFLATGQQPAPEYELILPKVLCNIPLATPVATNLNLTDSETAEAVNLLEAVIRYWEVLRNTSPDGLRGTFLLRPGKVSLHEDGDWLLQVEPSSVDILLGQLPWGISMVRLPWMKMMLWVEWS